MFHRSRVSGWVPVLAIAFVMLMAAQAGVLYYGVINHDPNTGALSGLAATTCGSAATIIMVGLWMGVTVNVSNCPGYAPKIYPELPPRGYAMETQIYTAKDGTDWYLHYSWQQIQGLRKIIQAGNETLPFTECQRVGFSRGEWSQMKEDFIRAGIGERIRAGTGWGIRITEDGVQALNQWYATHPHPRERYTQDAHAYNANTDMQT